MFLTSESVTGLSIKVNLATDFWALCKGFNLLLPTKMVKKFLSGTILNINFAVEYT